MSLLSFPTGYPIAEQNPETEGLELTQGWIQSFSIFNANLEGDYSKNRATKNKDATTKNNFNPLVSSIFISYTEDITSEELNFPFKLWGFLDIRDSQGAITQTVLCNGTKSITINNINSGDFITGTLTSGE
jgi:hypothetical protein